MRILVTGGAGFIGSHLCDRLLDEGHEVISFDNLDRQVHPTGDWPDYQPQRDRLHRQGGDIFDGDALAMLFEKRKPEVVIHLAAKVGVGQSAMNPFGYVLVNAAGTAALLEAMQNAPVKPQRLIVASSMSAYGEGAYYSSPHSLRGVLRSRDHLLQASRGSMSWEPRQRFSRSTESVPGIGHPVGITEDEPFETASIYAETKATTERMALIWGEQQEIPTAACRFFNVFGTRQAPTNPYTGVVATFLSAALRGEPPVVYEDGRQSRDFIDVRTVARVLSSLATEHVKATGPFNVCTGRAVTIGEVASAAVAAAQRLGSEVCSYDTTGMYRVGDVRHCIGDPSRLESLGIDTSKAGDEQYLLLGGMDWVASWMTGRDLAPCGNPHAEMQAAGLLFGPGAL